MSNQTHEQKIESQAQFKKVLNSFTHAMLVTRSSQGELHSRPMAIAEIDQEGAVWLLTDPHSPKVEELGEDARVNVNLQDGQKFCALSGKAEVMRDPAHVKRLWSESWRVWFPKGPTEEIALIKVVPQHGEYWDGSGLAGVKHLFKATKAYLKGERPKMDNDQHGKVAMQQH